MEMEKIFLCTPMGKPRMTQRDKWKKRDAVVRYHEFKDVLNWQLQGFEMPESNYHLIFHLPMPKTWPKQKKDEMNAKPHQTTPDKDNLEKAFLDALCKRDEHIWDGRVTKLWAFEGKIVVKYNLED